MPSFPPNVPVPPGLLTVPPNDAIARSKRVMALIDSYLDKPTSDSRAAIRSQLMQEFTLSDDAQRAAEKVKAEALSRLREQAELHRMALVPFRITRAMRDVIEQQDWEWADVLAAADSVTEESYSLAAMRADRLPEKAIDAFIEGYVLEADAGALVPTEHERLLLKDAMLGLLVDPAFTAALAENAAQQSVLASLTDAEIIAIRQRARAADPAQRWGDTLAFGRDLIETVNRPKD